MKKNLFLCALLLITASAMAQNPVISFSKTTHDFGNINEADGRVTTIFEFTNTGMKPLVLSNVKASCGCTTPTWTKTPIEPGQKGNITVTYNPAGRPGKFTKSITITSNATEPTTRLTIRGEVVPRPAKPADKYPIKMGELGLVTKSLQFANINKGTSVSRGIEYANNTDKEITVEIRFQSKDMAYIAAAPSMPTIKPGETGTINVRIDTKKCKIWGPINTNLLVVVNGKVVDSDMYKLDIRANIVEDFTQMTTEEKQQAPILELSTREIDLGKIKSGSKITYKLIVKNAGVKNLEIRRITNNHENLKITPSKTSIASGKKAEIKVELTALTNGQAMTAANYMRQFGIQTNDPKNTLNNIIVKWTVE